MNRIEQAARAGERVERIANMEAARMRDIEFVNDLQTAVAEQAKCIVVLEQQTAEAAGDISMITGGLSHLRNTVSLHAEHIERLEAALRDVVRCLIDGSVDVDIDAAAPGTMFHRHRILGSESVQAIVEVHHRLKAGK